MKTFCNSSQRTVILAASAIASTALFLAMAGPSTATGDQRVAASSSRETNAGPAQRGGHEMVRYTISGGGRIAMAGPASQLSGTLGQTNDGVIMSSGTLELTGGFWSRPAPAETSCPCADFTGDNLVNLVDFVTFQVCFDAVGPNLDCPPDVFPCADLNADGRVNLVDFVTFQTIFFLTPDGIAPPDCLNVD